MISADQISLEVDCKFHYRSMLLRQMQTKTVAGLQCNLAGLNKSLLKVTEKGIKCPNYLV